MSMIKRLVPSCFVANAVVVDWHFGHCHIVVIVKLFSAQEQHKKNAIGQNTLLPIRRESYLTESVVLFL